MVLEKKKSFETRCLYLAVQKLWVRRDLRYFPDEPTYSRDFIWTSALPSDQRTDAPGEGYDDAEEYQCLGLLLPLR